MRDLLRRLQSDESLMLAYRRGDVAAFEHLYQRHKDGLFTFLFRQCQEAAVVEELAQEAWVAVVNAADRYRPEARFRTWLYQIGRNKLADHWRRQEQRAAAPVYEAEQTCCHEAPDCEPLEEQVLRAVGRLPREQKDTLLLLEQGFSHREIAGITGSNEETVKSRLRYARKHLRQQLGGDA